jgi:phage tail sheath gpL-like
MSIIPQTARASVNGTGTKNVQFVPVSQVLQSRVVLALQYDQAKTATIENVLQLVTSPEDAADKWGFGSQLHRAILRQWAAHEGAVEVWAIPIPEDPGTPAFATGTYTFTNNATSNGVQTFYIGGDKITINVTSGDTPTVQGDALVTAITNNPNLPVTATNAAGIVTCQSKWKDLVANEITLKYNLLQAEQDAAPTGTTVGIVAMASGLGTSDITVALNQIVASSTWFTDLVVPYADTSTLDEIETAIGNPDSFTGLYGKIDESYRPLTNWAGNVEAGSTGLTNAIAVGNARKTDAVNDYVNAPDYLELPFEIAAYVCGFVALKATDNPASHYHKTSASALFGPEDINDDWTTNYTSRDTALKAGLSLVYLVDNSPVLGDIVSFYHPDGVANPAFQFEVNKRKIWNIAKDVKADKADPQRQGAVLVENAEAATDQPKATDEDLELARIVSLADQWAARGLLFGAAFTKKNSTATINVSNPDRIDRTIKCILSANARIRDDTIEVDRNTTIVNISLTST